MAVKKRLPPRSPIPKPILTRRGSFASRLSFVASSVRCSMQMLLDTILESLVEFFGGFSRSLPVVFTIIGQAGCQIETGSRDHNGFFADDIGTVRNVAAHQPGSEVL